MCKKRGRIKKSVFSGIKNSVGIIFLKNQLTMKKLKDRSVGIFFSLNRKDKAYDIFMGFLSL